MRIRPARSGEAKALTALCLRSKAHWGYDAEFMRLSARTLVVREDDIAAGRVLVAADAGDRPVGVAAVVGEGADDGKVVDGGGVADLADMFVDPPAIGSGAGRALFEAAADLARRLGATTMRILADPNAAPFYERMGARFVRMAPSDAIPGRSLPLYEFALGANPKPAEEA